MAFPVSKLVIGVLPGSPRPAHPQRLARRLGIRGDALALGVGAKGAALEMRRS